MNQRLAVGMLFASRSGNETRSLMKEKSQEGKDLLKSGVDQGQEYIKRRGTELADQANDQIDRVQNAVNKQKDKLTGVVEAGIAAYAKTVGATK